MNPHNAQGSASQPHARAQQPDSWYETTTASTSAMIGPTTTFYNPDDVAQREGTQYQQWLDTFGSQPSQEVDFSSYRRDVIQQQIPYGYMQEQYPSTNPISQYAGSSGSTVRPSGVGPMGDATAYPSQPGDMPYYYNDMLASSSSSSPEQGQYQHSTPESTLHSYSNTPDPVYQQQYQQAAPPPAPTRTHQRPPQQQQQQQQHRQQIPMPRHTQRQPKPPAPIAVQQQHPPQYQQARFVSHRNEATAASHSTASSLSPPSASWASEVVYPNQNQNPQPNPGATQGSGTTSGVVQAHAYKVPSNAPGGASSSTYSGGAAAPVAGPSTLSPEKLSGKRKRVKKDDVAPPEWGPSGSGGGFSDSESDDDDGSGLAMSGGIHVGMGGLGVVGKSGGRREKGGRLPGACTHCKKLKMKCDFPKHDNTCKRCKSGGHVCIVEGRRPRTAPNKREYLLAQIRQKDSIIESLLKQLHNPYLATPLSIASYRMATSPSDHNNRNVLAWLDRLQSSVRDAGSNKGTPYAFSELRNMDGIEDESDNESEKKRAHGSPTMTLKELDGNDAGAGAEEGEEANEKQQSALPDAHVPLGLIADLSLSNNKTRSNRKKDQSKDAAAAAAIQEEDYNDDNVGVANETYFMPGPATDLGIRATLIEQHSPPEILVHGLVKPEDVEKLFQIFYERVNPFISLLDPVLHTPASTFARCPFLFTVVCAIASRYYADKSEIYPIAMHFAKHSAANALIDGWKSVELCQAYILMSIYAVPARRWEEDRSWLYTGLAIRIATDLNLHQVTMTKTTSERQEREILNKTRVWMICFNLDRSTATQFGKPSTIKEDFITKGAKDWYKKSQYNHCYDIHLCGYSALLQIVAKFHDEIFSDSSSPTGLNKRVDFRAITLAHDANLTKYHEEWLQRFKEDSDPNDPACVFRCSLLPFLVGYSRLVMFSFGFQQAYQRGFEAGDRIFFTTCLDAAKSVIENMIDGLAPSGYMRFAPDGHFIFASFASAFLLKLLKPEFSSFLVKEQESEIFDLIGRLIQTLSSPKISIDDRHTPKLYARFLAGLLSRHRRDGATVGRLQTNPPPSNQIPGSAPPQSSTSTVSSFSLSRPSGSGGQSGEQRYSQGSGGMQQAMDTPVYTPEATFAAGTGAIHFAADFDMAYGGNGFSDEEMLATMQAIKNPAWWSNMMMPGFSWPEASPSPPAHQTTPLYQPNLPPMGGGLAGLPGMHPSYGIFQGTQVMM